MCSDNGLVTWLVNVGEICDLASFKNKEVLNIKLYEMVLSKSDDKQYQCTKIRNQHEYFLY